MNNNWITSLIIILGGVVLIILLAIQNKRDKINLFNKFEQPPVTPDTDKTEIDIEK